MKTLTTKQEHLLGLLAVAKPSPTVRELGTILGTRSTCTTQRKLDALIRRGLVTREHYGPRSRRVTPAGYRALRLPVPTCARCGAQGELLVTDTGGREWCEPCAEAVLAGVRV
jgi:predicted transcriptional regulator